MHNRPLTDFEEWAIVTLLLLSPFLIAAVLRVTYP